MDKTMLEWALVYAAKGWPVFPCHTNRDGVCSCGATNCSRMAKHPCTHHGHTDATTSPEIIQKWWAKWPDANIGFSVPSDMAVLDVDNKPHDGKHGNKTLVGLEALHGPLPDTVSSLTGGGGQQHFFRVDPNIGLQCVNNLFPSIDLKTQGGYVILPPALHASGKHYEWELFCDPNDLDVAPLPQWIIDARLAPKGTARHTLPACQADKVPEGERNTFLFTLASSLRQRGLSELAMLAALVEENNIRCEPPLPDSEVKTLVHSAARYAQGPVVAKGEWAPLIPLHAKHVPAFPVDCLPSPVREFVRAVAESVQVSDDMAAVTALAAVALCIQKKFKVRGKPDWMEPVNLYATVVASPAERKSAVTELMTRPIFEFEQTTNDFLQAEIEEYEIRRSVLTKTVKSLEDGAARPKKSGNIIDISEVLNKRQELSAMEAAEPRPLRLWTDDATMEALTSLLAENGGRMAVISAEDGIFEVLNGRYTSSVNIDIFLKAHAGDSVRVDRKGRPSEYIRRPAMTVFLAIQPVVLDGLMCNGAFRGRGLTARFLYSLPAPRVGSRTFETPPIPDELGKAYSSLIHNLLALPLPEQELILELSEEAYTLSASFAEGLEPRLVDDLEAVTDWAGKLHGAVLRIAGILRCIQHGHGASQMDISRQTMQGAITIGEYFLEHAQAAYRLMDADKAADDARYILRMLEKGRHTEIAGRELLRLCRKFSTVEEMKLGIDLLIDCNYMLEANVDYKGAGRRPGSKYLIHPNAYQMDVTDVTNVTEDKR